MFLMKNKVGNIFKRVSTESKKKELESLGYSVVSGEASVPEPAPKMLDDDEAMKVTQSANSGAGGAQGDGEEDKDTLAYKLGKMKKDELKKYAAENGIDLGSAKSIKEIIAVILEASKPATVE